MPVTSRQGEIDLFTLHKNNPERFPFLLESVSVSPLSRYSILFACPKQYLQVPFGSSSRFLTELNQQWQAERGQRPAPNDAEKALPFRGGWFLFLNYELTGQLEPILKLNQDVHQLPLAIAVRIPAAIIVDHLKQQTWLSVEDTYEQEFAALEQTLQQAPYKTADNAYLPQALTISLQEEDPQQFLDGVTTVRDYIRAGDVFQVNLSRGWQTHLAPETNATELYQRLRLSNPAPFACLADFKDFAIISSSPERLVSVDHNGLVATRPIAGTRPRSTDTQKDQQLLQELIAHPKERAEHIMLLDLERNDLGRVCTYGSIHVNELMVIESYQHVHHIVSNVQGQLYPGTTPGRIIRALFPGGTITGCPKVRCMEIIAELEPAGRGAYTGSVGYLNHEGDMDLNILIRTMTLQKQQLNFRCGAGIVIDSIPENELKETRHKSKGLVRALKLNES